MWSRRDVLAAGCAAAGSLAVGPSSRGGQAGSQEQEGPYRPFKMGIQSYSLRGLNGGSPDLRKALAATKELGLHFWEAYPAHVPVNPGAQASDSIQKEIERADVKLVGYGVVRLTASEQANRPIFDFARRMGLEYISADPDPDAFDQLDRLVEAYGVAVGIHNHGPGHRYDKIETIAKAIKDHHPKIGCCIDTGHFLRSREDPVQAVEAFGDRVYGVHLKDVKDAETFTILGKGNLRTADFLKALARNHYNYCLAIEYEENPENPLEDIKNCLAETRKAIAQIGRV